MKIKGRDTFDSNGSLQREEFFSKLCVRGLFEGRGVTAALSRIGIIITAVKGQ